MRFQKIGGSVKKKYVYEMWLKEGAAGWGEKEG